MRTAYLGSLRFLTMLAGVALTGTAVMSTAQAATEDTQEAIFAGGCFWCVEEAFDKVEGVISTTSGFTGGRVKNPSYKQVTGGDTGHAEAVEVEYDPQQVSYDELLDVFWRNIDPFAENRQFCDRGDSYRSALFPVNAEQRALAKTSRDTMMERFDQDIATRIEDYNAFYPAEDYHQNYYKKNPLRYRFYKSACGRVERLKEIWGDEAGGLTADGHVIADG